MRSVLCTRLIVMSNISRCKKYINQICLWYCLTILFWQFHGFRPNFQVKNDGGFVTKSGFNNSFIQLWNKLPLWWHYCSCLIYLQKLKRKNWQFTVWKKFLKTIFCGQFIIVPTSFRWNFWERILHFSWIYKHDIKWQQVGLICAQKTLFQNGDTLWQVTNTVWLRVCILVVARASESDDVYTLGDA